MRTTAALVLAAAALAVPAGSAHAGSVAVGKKAEIKVDPKRMAEEKAQLWERFGGWCAIADWHPAVAGCEESRQGEAVLRTLTLKDGGTIKERLTDQTATSYRYEILESPLPVKNYEAQFSLTPDDDDEDEINFAWAATFDPDGKPAKEARKIIDDIIRTGLESIEAAVEKARGK